MQIFKKYAVFTLTDEQIKNNISEILKDVSKYNNDETIKTIFSLIDLTTLNSFDTSKTIDGFIDQLNVFPRKFPKYPNVAAICVYPPFINQIKNRLNPQNSIKIASVGASFPSSQTFLTVKTQECELILKDGADELDIVISLRLFLEQNYNKVIEEIQTIKNLLNPSKQLKVILETGVLKDARLIYEASLLAMEAGADFIKTSTGKLEPAATLEAVYVMCLAIQEFNKVNYAKRNIGLKAAGGISTSDEAIKYFAVVKKVLGDKYLKKELFRIGASKLANNILSRLEGCETNYFGERVLKNEKKDQKKEEVVSEKTKKIKKENNLKQDKKETAKSKKKQALAKSMTVKNEEKSKNIQAKSKKR